MANRHRHAKRSAGGREPGIATPKVVDNPITAAGKGLAPMKGVSPHGMPASFHLGKRGRKRGGAVGCDAAPLSSAAKHGGVHAGENYKRGGETGKKWVGKAFGAHPGALHRALHVPKGEKIPEKKLAKAEHSENPKMRKRPSWPSERSTSNIDGR